MINIVDPESLLEHEQPQELNGLITTIVSAPYSKELEKAFYIGSRDIDDHNIFWTYKVDKRTKENNNIILNGTYSLFDDLKAYGVIRDKRPNNASATTALGAILEGSRWQVGNVTSTHTGTANWYYVSRLEAFWEFLENWNVEFKPRMTFSGGKITGRYIDIVDKLSDDYGKWYEYGDSLLTVTAEQASNALYTAFIGRGKGEEVGNGYGRRIGFEDVVWSTDNGNPVNKPAGQDYVEIPSATELYGYSDGSPRMTVVTFEDTETPELLIQQTYDYALNECRPKLQLKSEVLEDGVSELGETCTIIRDDIGIRYKTRVFKLTRNFLNKKKKTVEFGDEIVQSAAKRNSQTAKAIKKQEKQTISWLDTLQQELLDSYFNEDGYNYDLKAGNEYDLPGGFYSFNAPIDQNPTKLIYMGAGTMAIANSKTPDGQWNFRTWGTGDGFTADLINVGVINNGRPSSWDLLSGLIQNTGSTTQMRIQDGKIEFYGKEDDLYYGGLELQYFSSVDQSSLTFTNAREDEPGMRLSQNRIETTQRDQDAKLYLTPSGTGTVSAQSESSGGYYGMEAAFLKLNNRGELYETTGGQLNVQAFGTLVLRQGSGSYAMSFDATEAQLQRLLNMSNNPIVGVDGIDLRYGSQLYETTGGQLNVQAHSTLVLRQGDGTYAMSFDAAEAILQRTLNMSGYSIINQSDVRLKTKMEDSELNALREIERLEFIEFEWDKSKSVNKDKPDGRHFGIKAQYAPFLQTKAADSESYLSVDLTKQVNLNSKAIQELNEENKALKEEIRIIKEHLGLT